MSKASSKANSLDRLEGKVAVITGGASGIGEAAVKLFVSHGARVIVADVQDEKGEALCASLGGAASYVHCDVRLEADVKRAVDTAISLHGRLDVMFNNAGISDPAGSSILGEGDLTAAFERVMGVNVLGALLGTKHAARAMTATPGGGGSIITTASVASVMGGLAPPVYTCSKHALLGLTRAAATELGKHGVRVNCVSPALVATPQAVSHTQASLEELEAMGEAISTLKGVKLKAEDIAEAALFLASDESRFVSGHNLMQLQWSLDVLLEGKVAVITGGASGIGEAAVKLFVSHGARVIVADVQDEKGEALCASLGGAASYVHCDVRLEADVKRAVDTAISLHGRLDVMFNNAGISDPAGNSILGEGDLTAAFERVMGVNVLGALLGTKHAARAMTATPGGGGSIITTASVASVMGGLAPPVYTCSKHALLGLTRAAATELGKHGVRVNCVSPALVATPQAVSHTQASLEELEAMGEAISTLKGVKLKAEDIAEAALFLASDESRFVSGHNLMVDGASTATKIF
ncbi:hypothetical protein ZIOFF_046442 [Zingiber officinale]|uniref:Uncharacterized protein n=1 Tax=Zingiber officinale TaxID=94328 RepID=A0A8J5KSU3_ZINOF|nr:hypothetical protein ZIOFF_046442 [Zingiber officinale]